MAGLRVGKSPWFWGLLGLGAVGLALVIRFDLTGFFADGGRAAKAWDWVERGSWFAGIASLVIATVTARSAAQATTQPGGGPVSRAAELPLVRDVTARQALGIHPAIPLAAVADDRLPAELPLYVPRDRDVDVRTALTRMSATGGFLLLVGPPASGKTRCAAEAMQQLLGKWRLCLWSAGYDPGALLDAGTGLRRTVVWLDDLHELLEVSADAPASASDGGGSSPRQRRLTSELIRRLLLPENGPVILIGTTWPERRDRFTRPPVAVEVDLFADARKVVGMAEQIDMVPVFSQAEWNRAVALSGGDPRLAEAVQHEQGRALPATLASARELTRRWRHGGNPYGQAVISAGVDARRCGHPEPIPVSLLQTLAERYLTGPQRAAAAPDEWFAEALTWAWQPVRGDIAALTPSGGKIGVTDGYRVSDILLDHASSNPDVGPVAASIRRDVVEHADPAVCFILLVHADEAGEPDIAELAGRRGAEAGYVPALFNLAVLLAGRGRVEEAEALYRRAVDAGAVDALFNLAVLLAEGGRVEEAEALYRRAVDAGNVPALNNLANLLSKGGRAEEAEALYRRAVDAGAVDALNSLAVLLSKGGRVEEAEALFRRAVDAGNVPALTNLAVLLADGGRVEEAEALFRRAVDAGNVPALTNLAVLLAKGGRVEEAEALYRRAVDAGNVSALFNLAVLLAEGGRVEEAEALYRRAVDAGAVDALFNLAVLLAKGGRAEEAEALYRRAVDAGNVPALNNLANLLADGGRTEEAEALYRRAVDAGNVNALNNLAVLLAEGGRAEGGRAEEAEALFRRAVDADDVNALFNLAVLLAEGGRVEEAEALYRRAVDAGNVSALFNLAVLLAKGGRAEEAEALYRRAVDAGNVDALNNLANLLADGGRTEEAEALYRRAVDAGHVDALNNLAVLLAEGGRAEEAEALFRRAVDAGAVDALTNLANLLKQQTPGQPGTDRPHPEARESGTGTE